MKNLNLFAVLFTLFASSAQAAPLFTLSCAADSEGTVARISLSTALFGFDPPSRMVVSDVRIGEVNARGEVRWDKSYAAESDTLVFATDANASKYVRGNVLSLDFSGKTANELTVAIDYANLTVTLYDLIDGGNETLVCHAL